MKFIWLEKDKSLYDIENATMKIHIKWSGETGVDYVELSRQYINAGYITLKEITENSYSNSKLDMWFLPGVYMMRQAIELLLKAGIAINGSTKREVQETFIETKHNVSALYKIYKGKYEIEKLSPNEQIWLETYLDSIELVDSSSDLFRYPFKDDFMQQYGNQALDICHMGNRLVYCYSTLNKMLFGEWFDAIELNFQEKPQFIQLASSYMGNCYLFDSLWSDGSYKQVTGYSEVAGFLFEKFKESKNEVLFYPIVFLMRNAIEIGLKRLLHVNMEQYIEERTIRGKRNSHLLFKDLWKTIKPLLIHYSNEDNQDEETLELAESYIKSLSSLDKNGDMFRYPCSYSHEYKFNDRKIDLEIFYNYLLGLFHFIDSCNDWLGNIMDYEMELRSEYLSDMQSYMD